MTTTAPIAIQNPWLHPLAASEPPPLWERLTRALEAHAAAESHGIASCQQLADRMADPVASLLMGLIVEDDQRHHSVLQSMVRRLQEEVEFVNSPTALPVPSDTGSVSTKDEVAELTASLRGLIRDEHEGARYLRHLGRQEPNLYGGLYPLLLETIARDSEKHALILRFLLRSIESRSMQ